MTVPEVTEAIPGAALDQVPLDVAFDKSILEPTFTDEAPVVLTIDGSAFTVVEIVLDDAGLPIAHSLSEVTVA